MAFDDLSAYDGLAVLNEACSDTPGQSMPLSVSWKTNPVDTRTMFESWSVAGVSFASANIRLVDGGALLLSPRWAVVASHVPGTGLGYHWLDSSNNRITATASLFKNVADDLTVIRLNSAVTAIAPATIAVDASSAVGHQVVTLEADRTARLSTITAHTNSHLSWDDTGLESGDSGKPWVLLWDGEPVHLSLTTGASFGNDVAAFRHAINDWMRSDGESLTTVDIGAYPTPEEAAGPSPEVVIPSRTVSRGGRERAAYSFATPLV